MPYKTLHMRNNGNENRAVQPNSLLDDLETNMVCGHVQYLNSDQITRRFQNGFGPDNGLKVIFAAAIC